MSQHDHHDHAIPTPVDDESTARDLREQAAADRRP